MKPNTSTITAVCLLLILSASACRKKTPVNEISVSDSGIAIEELDVSFATTDWPGWRGSSGDGIAPDQDVVTHWSANKNIRWRADVPGRGHSSPVVVGDKVIIGTAIKDKEQQLVIAYSRVAGDELWRAVIHEGGFPAERKVHRKATNANGTVAFDGKLLFTAFLNSDKIFVTSIDLDGNKVWQREIGAFDSKFGYAPSPVLYKSLVIVAADNYGGGYLAAMDRETGEIAWRVARGDASSYSSPAVATVGGRDQLLITGGDRLVSYNPSTGKELWSTPCIAEATCGTVVVAGDKIFAAGGYPNKETVCLSADGAKLWSNNTKAYEPSMIAYAGHLFAISDDGIATCWSVKDGKQAWRKRLGGNFSSSPVICNGNIYVANLAGECFVFKAAGDGYEPIATNRLGDDAYASPAIAAGEIFFRIGIGQDRDRKEQLVCIAGETTDAAAAQ